MNGPENHLNAFTWGFGGPFHSIIVDPGKLSVFLKENSMYTRNTLFKCLVPPL